MSQSTIQSQVRLPSFDIARSRLVRYLPFLFIGLIISFKLVSQEWYWTIFCMEDGPVEYLTALAYLIASLICGAKAWSLYRQPAMRRQLLILIGITILLFVISMEEISWGQRILGLQSPEFFHENNYQQELTLHNLLSRYPLHMVYILAGLYGAYAWKYFPKQWQKKWPKITALIVPHRSLRGYFLPVALLYIYYDYVSAFLVRILGLSMFSWGFGESGWLISRDQEPAEFLMALGVMFFTLMLAQRSLLPEKPALKSH